MAQQKRMKCRIPFLTLSLIGLALFVYTCPYLDNVFVFDRQAILEGEWWRLGTAPFVHFSVSHMGWNLLVLGAAGWAIEAAGYRYLWLMYGVAAVVPGLLYLLTMPELAVYGGLSGLATGAVAYLGLSRVFKSGQNRLLWLAVLALMIGKIWTEAALKNPIFARPDDIPFRVLPLVHGVSIAVVAGAVFWTAKGRRLWSKGDNSAI